MKLTIKNFQALKDIFIEFPIGITTIVGASNNGKTAIIRAITSLLTNPPEAKTYINYDSDKTSVNLLYNNNDITWERTEKESFYKINDVSYQKVGRTDLFELLPNNGFEKGEDHDILNIEDEYSYLFPFSNSDSQIYKIFESAFAINNSTDVLQKIKTDELSSRKNLSVLNDTLTKTKNKVGKIEDFLSLNSYDSVINQKNELETKAISLSKLNKDCDSIYKNSEFLKKCEDFKTIDFDLKVFDNYSNLCEDVKFIESNIKLLNFNTEVPNFDLKIFDNYFKLESDLEYLLKNIKLISKKSELVDFDFKIFDNYFKLEQDVNEILKLIAEYKKLGLEEEQIKQEMAEIENLLSQVGICPLCKQEIKKGDLV